MARGYAYRRRLPYRDGQARYPVRYNISPRRLHKGTIARCHSTQPYQLTAHRQPLSRNMPGVKRPSDGQPSAAKRSRPSTITQPNIIPEDQLQTMGKTELISLILKLQKQIATTAAQAAPPSPPATPALSKEDLQRKVTKARDMMEKGIKSQMKVSYPLAPRCPHPQDRYETNTHPLSGSHPAKAAAQGSPTRASWPPLASFSPCFAWVRIGRRNRFNCLRWSSRRRRGRRCRLVFGMDT